MVRTKRRAAKRVSPAAREKALLRAAAREAQPARKKVTSDQMFALIQDKAREIYVLNGCQAGRDLTNWYEAEAIVKKELGIR